MKAEIDQSGRIERLNTHTVISIANHNKGSVYLSVSEKVKIIKILRKSIFSRKDLIQILFSVLIYILIQKYGKGIGKVVIDEEYTGQDDAIKSTIYKLYLKYGIKNKPMITFGRVGKKSPAHILAWGIHRNKRKNAPFVLKAEDILKLIRI